LEIKSQVLRNLLLYVGKAEILDLCVQILITLKSTDL
jgi:hypothetical protein